ncbi:hypothetical protein BDB00DRAFT_746472, partial [Zychaea mexicana]|uniref:uncharacterized protein n=1 Tax=Zychaea mexicana TaxID=64656 RepID=UPI0022FF0F78
QEVTFVHRYSGYSLTRDACLISTAYIGMTSIFLYLAAQVPSTDVDKHQVRLGSVMFLVGECTNFYHHSILSNLRTKGDTTYKIPEHGLFSFTWCPHY